MSQVIEQDENYTFEILQEKDCVECAAFLAHSFTKHNPYELYMKTTFEEFYDDALSLCKAIVNTNLSVIARDKQTNEIHGIVQGVDEKTFFDGEGSSDSTDNGGKRADPIMELLPVLRRRYLEDYEKKHGELKENSVVHILMAGVRPDSSGRGEFHENTLSCKLWCCSYRVLIFEGTSRVTVRAWLKILIEIRFLFVGLGTKLNQVLLEHAHRRGFKHVIVDVISPAIYHIYTKKLNGKVFTSIHAPSWISKDGTGHDYRPLEHFNADIPLIVFDL